MKSNKPKSNKTNHPRSTKTNQPRNNVDFVKNKQKLESIYNKAINHINKDKNIKHNPMYKYIAGLIDFDANSKSVPTPLLPFPVHLKTVRTNTLMQVNANGNLGIFLQPAALQYETASQPDSPLMFQNAASYDPADVATLETGLTSILEPQIGADLSPTYFAGVRVQSFHAKFFVTGVNAYNKQGTIHLMESVKAGAYSGSLSTILPVDNIVYGPSHEIYKQIEVANMDPSIALQYNYFPISNNNLADTFKTPNGAAPSTITEAKGFALLVSGADALTKIRMEVEVTYECVVQPNYVNTYSIEYPSVFTNSEPMLNYLNQHFNVRISTRYNQKFGGSIVDNVVRKVTRQEKEMLDFSDTSSFHTANSKSNLSFVVK